MEVENMEKAFLQVRTDKSDKEQASDILENMGTNLSSVVNMLLKQIQASMDMENMTLTENDLHLLKTYQEQPMLKR